MAKKKAVSKKKASKKKISKKKVLKKKVKAAVDRRQVNIMLDEKSIKKLDKVRAKHSLTRSELMIKLIKSAS